ncbi:wsv086 [White spot syndrome virus]|uniref:Wsv086 n=3 Tax=White spot syndrome virus TaxID=342409 RepID=Q8VB94_WSSVS|nr:wsv086 [Shrimp white spot syndrome virus]AAL33090.1 wsv086 [Shrimp white spot syndrome virus]AAL89011.1 WSSV143 [Shrimp white spot syndrome virus]AFX59463.1 wsv086 [White spot syndrome virus]AWQ62382.1 wsv086 [Shrimp white spot syndrome virus]
MFTIRGIKNGLWKNITTTTTRLVQPPKPQLFPLTTTTTTTSLSRLGMTSSTLASRPLPLNVSRSLKLLPLLPLLAPFQTCVRPR